MGTSRAKLNPKEIGRVTDRVATGPPQPVEVPDLGEVLTSVNRRRDDDHWIYRPDERLRILERLFLADGSPWLARFTFLLGASVVVATLGLANDQPAAVIAAMVIAPLMTPVLGLACSSTLGLMRHSLRLLAIITAGSIGAVVLGWAISATLVVHQVTPEELSRTEPRLRDLSIALAAGAAGMYSVVRKDLSSVVPGVAIAVALVPPLATVGLMVELGEWHLARGAALLYLVNVLAIVLAAVAVLLATDFMDSPSLRNPSVAVASLAALVLAVAVTVPVWRTSRRADDEVTFVRGVETALEEWADTHDAHRVVGADVAPGQVSIVIAGPTNPPGLDRLRTAVATEAYPNPVVEVDWVESSPLVIAD
ncbi:MAG: DUF389 domain-containing protein [Acidimicrobiia bacterium]|nr:DUF389 domain-containing protein [Acidimicrobiia bacterium]